MLSCSGLHDLSIAQSALGALPKGISQNVSYGSISGRVTPNHRSLPWSRTSENSLMFNDIKEYVRHKWSLQSYSCSRVSRLQRLRHTVRTVLNGRSRLRWRLYRKIGTKIFIARVQCAIENISRGRSASQGVLRSVVGGTIRYGGWM